MSFLPYIHSCKITDRDRECTKTYLSGTAAGCKRIGGCWGLLSVTPLDTMAWSSMCDSYSPWKLVRLCIRIAAPPSCGVPDGAATTMPVRRCRWEHRGLGGYHHAVASWQLQWPQQSVYRRLDHAHWNERLWQCIHIWFCEYHSSHQSPETDLAREHHMITALQHGVRRYLQMGNPRLFKSSPSCTPRPLWSMLVYT